MSEKQGEHKTFYFQKNNFLLRKDAGAEPQRKTYSIFLVNLVIFLIYIALSLAG